MTNTDEPAKKILILAANPKDTSPLRLDEEVRDIGEGLRRSAKRDQFDLEQRWATRPRDLRRALLEVSPQIVHFSGHGSHHEGLILEDEIGQTKSVSASALAGLFKLFSDQIECVLLNACYSASQAEAISQHVPYVIGTSQAISDRAAIEFAVGFYDALAAGHSVESAYKFGCISIQLAGGDESLTPVLVKGSTPKETGSKVTYEFVLSGSVDDVSREQLEAIVAHLRSISGDTSLALLKVEEGSILLELEGSEEGFRILEALQRDGKLTEVYGLRVKRDACLGVKSRSEEKLC
jgi:hypothetical protein